MIHSNPTVIDRRVVGSAQELKDWIVALKDYPEALDAIAADDLVCELIVSEMTDGCSVFDIRIYTPEQGWYTETK